MQFQLPSTNPKWFIPHALQTDYTIRFLKKWEGSLCLSLRYHNVDKKTFQCTKKYKSSKKNDNGEWETLWDGECYICDQLEKFMTTPEYFNGVDFVNKPRYFFGDLEAWFKSMVFKWEITSR